MRAITPQQWKGADSSAVEKRFGPIVIAQILLPLMLELPVHGAPIFARKVLLERVPQLVNCCVRKRPGIDGVAKDRGHALAVVILASRANLAVAEAQPLGLEQSVADPVDEVLDLTNLGTLDRYDAMATVPFRPAVAGLVEPGL